MKRLYVLPMPREFRPWTKNDLYPDYLTPEYFEIYKFAFEKESLESGLLNEIYIRY